VRDRASPEGKQLGIPYFLVDKHPERALAYAWVSEAHKEDARRVLRGEDLDDAQQASMSFPLCFQHGALSHKQG
jgi:hypothetical protein